MYIYISAIIISFISLLKYLSPQLLMSFIFFLSMCLYVCVISLIYIYYIYIYLVNLLTLSLDYAVISDETVFRTHTFEDWKLKFEKVTVGKGCVIRPSTTLMGGSVIGDHAIVEANTLVMKNEFITPGAIVGSIPAKTIGSVIAKKNKKQVTLFFCPIIFNQKLFLLIIIIIIIIIIWVTIFG